MSNLLPFLVSVQRLLEDARDGVLSGSDFVRQYDDLMADEVPDDLAGDLYSVLDEYQTQFALYVEDPALCASRPRDYYGYDVLRRKVQQLLEQLERLTRETK